MAVINGTTGNDTLAGTSDDDTLNGLYGQDTIYFGDNSGNDVVDGGTGGDDLTWGYSGFDGDFLIGDSLTQDATVIVTAPGTGSVNWSGGSITFTGVEQVVTGSGNDTLDARHLTDGMTPQQMADHYFGYGLYGGAGDDVIYGSDLRDSLDGGAGDDVIHAGGGNDLIHSSTGNDQIWGDGGDDGFRWGMDQGGISGHDIYYGGETDEAAGDALNFWGSDGYRVIFTGTEAGQATFGSPSDNTLDFYEFERFLGGEGNDYFDGLGATVQGSNGVDIAAGAGNDTVLGTSGNDLLRGDFGADVIIGGAGNDHIYANGNQYGDPTRPDTQADTIYFGNGDGNDVLYGFGPLTDPAGGPDIWPDKINLGDYSENGVVRHQGMTRPDGSPITLSDLVVNENPDGYAVVVFPGGESLTFDGLSKADLLEPGVLEQLFVFPCFVRGTLIQCAEGEVAVEDLRPGQLVQTRDNGLQPIRWIKGRKLNRLELALAPKLNPIRIAAGALGPNVPTQDLLVSPEHRILLRSSIARRMYGASEVLVAARQLIGLEGITQVEVAEVEYFHFLFDRHEIVTSNGAETESLFTGVEALKAVGAAARDEILTLFPELRDGGPSQPARPLIEGRQARNLARRHQAQRQPLLDRIS